MKIGNLIASVVVAGGMALSATAANAITVTDDGFSLALGAGSSSVMTDVDGATIDIDWTETTFIGTQAFTVDTNFDLFFTDYRNDDETGNGFSAFVLQLNGSNISEVDLPNCMQASPFDSDCQILSETGASGLLAGLATEPSADTPLYENLSAGSYLVGILSDGSAPSSGGVSFAISAVPLPAGFILFLSGLGMLGFMSRRKSA